VKNCGLSTGALFANFPDKAAIHREAMGFDYEVLARAAPALYAALDALLSADWRDGVFDHMPGVKDAREALEAAATAFPETVGSALADGATPGHTPAPGPGSQPSDGSS
jgi:AcrR family transcriptional regulator